MKLFLIIFTIGLFGVITAEINPRIVGGREAKPHEFPFLVSITLTETNKSNCGGTILSDKWILTAGHCIFNKDLDEIIIRAGKHDLTKIEEGEQIRKPAKFIVHGDFSPWAIGPNDIGLIVLAEPLNFTNTVKPIDAIPKRNETFSGPAIVSGWGSTSLTLDPEFPEKLQTATVPILPHNICADALTAVDYTEKHLCTGPLGGKIGHCGGDSGGPLVIKDNNGKFMVIGISSFSYTPCGTENIPPAFTRLSSFINWMDSKIVY
ncbi:trypsin-1-like [Condylostylus longicornis]|uniref:trypsin-1-like n=1 Tax=Condylostylus longicornis TaxID=2530218 RepID=UPI00244DFD44|nr:trypsin-1-like [Condylostylus longicornis]